MSRPALDGRGVATAVLSDLASGGRHAKNLVTSNVIISSEQESNDQTDDQSVSSDLCKKNLSPASVIDRVEAPQVPQGIGRSQDVLISLVAGAMAGALAKTTIAPLDRTKIYFQATQQRYTCRMALEFLSSSYKNEGFFSLWRGNSATMARIIPYAAVQFASHEQWKKLLHIDQPDNKQTPSWLRFVAGSLAGVTSQALTYPLDMARARMAVTQRNTYSSLSQVFIKIWKMEGPLTLYRGFTPTILGVIPYAGTSFGIYGTLKNYHKERTGRESQNPLERMVFGSVAGLFGQTSSYPLDIVRRRMQTASVTGNGHCYKTILGTILKVYREEGIVHGLYKGLSLNWVKGPLAVGISFATFDTLKQFLEQLPFLR